VLVGSVFGCGAFAGVGVEVAEALVGEGGLLCLKPSYAIN
jgi:hypothetical protein